MVDRMKDKYIEVKNQVSRKLRVQTRIEKDMKTLKSLDEVQEEEYEYLDSF